MYMRKVDRGSWGTGLGGCGCRRILAERAACAIGGREQEAFERRRGVRQRHRVLLSGRECRAAHPRERQRVAAGPSCDLSVATRLAPARNTSSTGFGAGATFVSGSLGRQRHEQRAAQYKHGCELPYTVAGGGRSGGHGPA